MLKKQYHTFVENEDDEDDEDESELKKPKTIKYSKILVEEDDFWPEENFS